MLLPSVVELAVPSLLLLLPPQGEALESSGSPVLAGGTVWHLPGSHLRCRAHPCSRQGHFFFLSAWLARADACHPLHPQRLSAASPQGEGKGVQPGCFTQS